MVMRSTVKGNVLSPPDLKTVKINGKDQTICEIRIMSATLKREADGSYSEIKNKTFPVQGTIWHEKLANRVFYHIEVGASVTLTGTAYPDAWKDNKGEVHAGQRMDVLDLGLDLARVEDVIYRKRVEREEPEDDSEVPL